MCGDLGRKPIVESRKPKAESRRPKAESVLGFISEGKFRLRAPPWGGRGGGRGRWLGVGTKKCAPMSNVISSRFARARVSLSCESALPCSSRRCVRVNASLVSVGAPRHVPALPAWTVRATCSFEGSWPISAGGENVLILCSSQESVVLGRVVNIESSVD